MQVATISPDVTLTTGDETASGDLVRTWGRRVVIALFIAVGLAATAVILIQLGHFAVYGLPAPFIRRVA